MVLRSSAWSLPWEKVILMMLLTPFGVDLWNTLLYHLEALQLSFSPFFLCSFPTLSEGYNTFKCSKDAPRYRDRPRAYGSGSGPYCPLVSISVPDHMRSKMSTAAACETMFGWQRSSMRYGTKRMLASVVPRQ